MGTDFDPAAAARGPRTARLLGSALCAPLTAAGGWLFGTGLVRDHPAGSCGAYGEPLCTRDDFTAAVSEVGWALLFSFGGIALWLLALAVGLGQATDATDGRPLVASDWPVFLAAVTLALCGAAFAGGAFHGAPLWPAAVTASLTVLLATRRPAHPAPGARTPPPDPSPDPPTDPATG
ncbi:hypothetical protein ACIQXD_26350 [Streptomyces uncialis]|uniref:hypothetical protein n=1 Tax=Streptomyces uncialis TaxID=1048205 RepID=UPI0038020D03